MKIRQFIFSSIVLTMFGIGCNGPRNAYYYYRLVELEPYIAEVIISDPETDSGQLNFGDSLVSGTNAELLLVAKVKYYYKEKTKGYNPEQRGMKGSEEKIETFDLYLESEAGRTPLTNRVGKLVLKSASNLQNLPTGIAVNVSNREKRSLESLEDFITKFNAAETPFIYTHNLAPAYSFSLDTEGVPPGQYDLVIEIGFDSGKVVKNRTPLTIKR
jgi:hypothetical protein